MYYIKNYFSIVINIVIRYRNNVARQEDGGTKTLKIINHYDQSLKNCTLEPYKSIAIKKKILFNIHNQCKV